MKKYRIVSTLFVLMLVLATAHAIPAYQGTVTATQPDGTTLTLRTLGDEYLHFQTTDDGYTVVQDQQGRYVYVQLANGLLQPTDIIAHDAPQRSSQERTFLQGVSKRLAPQMTAEATREKQAELQRRAKARAVRRKAEYDYDNFRGLVLLVEFNDRKFSRTDYHNLMDDMINQENYTGYRSTSGRRENYVGSVRDYFHDNSGGLFNPQFDVVGPITVDRSQYYARGTNNAPYLVYDALVAASSQVDYRQYDGDGDGMVDMVYIVFAGYGANYGNDQRLVWPHASFAYDPYNDDYLVLDGVAMGRYACSTELYGTPYSSVIDGIGTICHEFSHVLGLPDLYDADYESSGGTSRHPGEWSLMAGGSYANYGRTPCAYTLYERYSVGFATPQPILQTGSYELNAIENVNNGYRLNSANPHEYFLIENRQPVKWDTQLPGHGLLVFRVDSTSTQVWENNAVNNNPAHQYFELLRAHPASSGDTDGDPFPGTGEVTALDNTTTPANLLNWSGQPSPFGLTNIAEQGGVITFDVLNVLKVSSVSLPDTLTVALGLSRQLHAAVVPNYAPCTLAWTSSDESVATVDDSGVVTGIKAGTALVTVLVNDSLSASCQVRVEAKTVVRDIAAFKALEPGTEAYLQLHDVQVLFAKDTVAYLRDASGALLISQTGLSASAGTNSSVGSALSRNQVLNGQLYGRRDDAGAVPQLLPVADMIDGGDIQIQQGSAAEPRVVQVEELTAADYSDLVRVERAALVIESDDDFRAAIIRNPEKNVSVYNLFGISGVRMPSDLVSKRFTITGIYGSRMLSINGIPLDDIYFTELMESSDALRFVLDYDLSKGGSLVVDGATYRQDGQYKAYEGDDILLQVVPDEGYVLQSAMLDDTDVTAQLLAGETLAISNLQADHNLQVTFQEDDTTGIGSHSRRDSSGSVTIYRLDGTRIAVSSPLAPGVYVVRTAAGNSKKVIMNNR